MFRERVMHATLNVVVRAHLTYGFSHFDLHPGNVLLRVYRRGVPIRTPHAFQDAPGSPDLRYEVRLFDFDLSYVPPADYLRERQEYHLWYHAALRGSDRPSSYRPFAQYRMLWDLVHIARIGIPERSDARTWERLRLHLNRLVPNAEEPVRVLVRAAQSLHTQTFEDVAAWIRREAVRPTRPLGVLYPTPRVWNGTGPSTNASNGSSPSRNVSATRAMTRVPLRA